MMDVDTASEADRLDGLLKQLRGDLPGANRATIDHAIRGRLADVGIDLPDEEIERHIDELMT